MDRSYIEENETERERMRRLVEAATDGDLRRAVNEHWTVAGVLGHVAFWDAWAEMLAGKLERGVPFEEWDQEPEDVSSINDSTWALIHAIAPREAARLAVRQAEQTDRLVASLPVDKMWPADASCPLNAFRSQHRREHLDEIETALRER